MDMRVKLFHILSQKLCTCTTKVNMIVESVLHSNSVLVEIRDLILSILCLVCLYLITDIQSHRISDLSVTEFSFKRSSVRHLN